MGDQREQVDFLSEVATCPGLPSPSPATHFGEAKDSAPAEDDTDDEATCKLTAEVLEKRKCLGSSAAKHQAAEEERAKTAQEKDNATAELAQVAAEVDAAKAAVRAESGDVLMGCSAAEP